MAPTVTVDCPGRGEFWLNAGGLSAQAPWPAASECRIQPEPEWLTRYEKRNQLAISFHEIDDGLNQASITCRYRQRSRGIRTGARGPASAERLPENALMVRLFTVKWPRLVSLEAPLLFVAIMRICYESHILRSAIDPLVAPKAHDLSIPAPVMISAVCGCVVTLPFLAGMMIVDRFLTVRKGFAWLSLLSVPVWALVGAGLSGDAAGLLPIEVPADTIFETVALFGASASLLLHGPALWIGLKDRGFVGLRLATRSGDDECVTRSSWRGKEAAWYAPNPRSRNDRPPGRRGNALLAWSSIFVTLTAGYMGYQHSQPDRSQPVAAPAPLPDVAADAPAPLPNVTTLAGEVSAARRSDGHFVFNVTVNGRPAAMLLDTGASVVTIRAEEAARLGLPMGRLKYTIKVSTANGAAMMAAVKIDTLTVGAITQHGVAAFVASAGTLNDDLLGQSFLRNLRQVTVENDHAILRGK